MSKIDCVIRLAKVQDFEQCIKLREALGENYTLDSKDKNAQKVFGLYVENDDKFAVVAEISGTAELVGCLMVDCSSQLCRGYKQGVAEGMAIDGNFRRKGIGRALLQAAITHLKSKGALSFVVRTPHAWESMKFYRSLSEFNERGSFFVSYL